MTTVTKIHKDRERRVRDDKALALKVYGKVVAAKVRGTLSTRCNIRLTDRQVLISEVTEEDFRWVRRHFPGGDYERHYRSVGPARMVSGARRNTRDSYRYKADLREGVEVPSWDNDWVPYIEVWGLTQPHECRDFKGVVDAKGKPRWRCGDRGCSKPLAVRDARAMGLVP